MSIHDHQIASTQMFAVTSNDEKLPAAQSILIESMSTQELIKPILVTNSNVDSTTTNKSHLNVSFQLAPTRLPSSSIQPEVTITDRCNLIVHTSNLRPFTRPRCMSIRITTENVDGTDLS